MEFSVQLYFAKVLQSNTILQVSVIVWVYAAKLYLAAARFNFFS